MVPSLDENYLFLIGGYDDLFCVVDIKDRSAWNTISCIGGFPQGTSWSITILVKN